MAAVVVKETYTSHTAVLQSLNMNVSFLHGSNVYIRDLESRKIHSVFVSSFQRLQFGRNVNLLNRTKIYQTSSGAEGYIHKIEAPNIYVVHTLSKTKFTKTSTDAGGVDIYVLQQYQQVNFSYMGNCASLRRVRFLYRNKTSHNCVSFAFLMMVTRIILLTFCETHFQI